MVFSVWVTFTEYKPVSSLKVDFSFTARHHRISLDNFAKVIDDNHCGCHLVDLIYAMPHAIYARPLEPLTPASNTFADGFLLPQ
jgi:hypothetical protein